MQTNWGTLYETLSTCEGDHEDKSLQKIFTLFRKLDEAKTLDEVKILLKEMPLTSYEQNRVNSPCYDGLLVSALKPKPLITLIRIYPEYLETCKYYLTRKMVKRALREACKYGREKIVELLLENGTDSDLVVKWEHLSIIKLYVEKKLVTPEVVYKEISSGVNCIANVKKEILEYLLQLLPNLSTGQEFLHSIVKTSDIEFIKSFLNKGVIQPTNELLHYVLFYGRMRNKYEIAELLIDRGTDIRENDNEMLKKALKFNRPEIVKFILSQGVKIKEISNLDSYLYNVHISILKLLLENGANPNARCKNDVPILFEYVGEEKAITLLISFGADPKTIYDGSSLLFSFFPNDRAISRLIDIGVRPTKKELETQEKFNKPLYQKIQKMLRKQEHKAQMLEKDS